MALCNPVEGLFRELSSYGSVIFWEFPPEMPRKRYALEFVGPSQAAYAGRVILDTGRHIPLDEAWIYQNIVEGMKFPEGYPSIATGDKVPVDPGSPFFWLWFDPDDKPVMHICGDGTPRDAVPATFYPTEIPGQALVVTGPKGIQFQIAHSEQDWYKETYKGVEPLRDTVARLSEQGILRIKRD